MVRIQGELPVIRYRLYYAPEFDLSRPEVDYSHAEPKSVAAFVESVRASIEQEGLRNPLLVTLRGGRLVVHPGKCRAKACISLGMTRVPAVIYAPERRHKAPDGAQEITVDEARALFSGDCVVEASDRFFAVKKAPT